MFYYGNTFQPAQLASPQTSVLVQQPSGTAAASSMNSLSDVLLGDVGLISLAGAFVVPVVGSLAGAAVSPMVLGLQTALGTTGAGLSFLYPQAFQKISSNVKTLPTWLVAGAILGGGAAVVLGAYYGNKYLKKKHGNKLR